MMRSSTLLAFVACAAFTPLPARAETVLLQETMDFPSPEEFKNSWATIDAKGNFYEIRADDPEIPTSPYAFLRNALLEKQLQEPLRNKDWTLRFKAIHSDTKRVLWLGLFNDDGTKGYAVLWDSGNSGFDYEGLVSLRKFDLDSPLAEWGEQNGEILVKAMSGHSVSAKPLAEFELHRDHSSGMLTVTVDGMEILSVVDKDFGDFSKLLIKTNEQSLDDISVTTP